MSYLSRLTPLVGVPAGLTVAGVFVWQASFAAFSATTTDGVDSWAAGSVSFGTNAPATAMFTASGLKPGSTGTACVKITYTGSLAASVRLYLKNADLGGTGLASYLTFQVNEGTGSGASWTTGPTGQGNAVQLDGTADGVVAGTAPGVRTDTAVSFSVWANRPPSPRTAPWSASTAPTPSARRWGSTPRAGGRSR
ncbi:hypothetical protein [Dactylosporangium sp. NPDC050588]|uniref:hypothetical protein n=1 Tax=Dactylosporangium sp. NPDC050588 TaxID=3157211 RepID=UPI0034092304